MLSQQFIEETLHLSPLCEDMSEEEIQQEVGKVLKIANNNKGE